MTAPYTVAFVFARGGSKSVHHKNLRTVGGKSLVALAVECARASRLIDRVCCSTDDPEIAEAALLAGAELPFLRPEALAADDTAEHLAWQHAIREMDWRDGRPMELFVSVPPTGPLRSVEDIDNCIRALLEDPDADAAITMHEAPCHPWYDMLELDPGGYVRLMVPPVGAERELQRRQDAPTVYAWNTVAYAARPAYVLGCTGLVAGRGRIRGVLVPQERALDINTEFDLRVAGMLWEDEQERRRVAW